MHGTGCTRIVSVFCNQAARHALQCVKHIYHNSHRFHNVPLAATFNVKHYMDHITTHSRPIRINIVNISSIPPCGRERYTLALNAEFNRIWLAYESSSKTP